MDLAKAFVRVPTRIRDSSELASGLNRHPEPSTDREREEQALKNMQTALNKMRALREAMVVEEPTGYLH